MFLHGQMEAQRLCELQGEVNGMTFSCHANSILDAMPAANQPSTINASVTRVVSHL
jgi:hypothetical protein